MKIVRTDKPDFKTSVILILKDDNLEKLKNYHLNKEEIEYIKSKIQNQQTQINLINPQKYILIQVVDNENNVNLLLERFRKVGFEVNQTLNSQKIETASLFSEQDPNLQLAFLEGLALSNYQFLKYKNNEEANTLKTINVSKRIPNQDIETLQIKVESVFISRNLVNEPYSFLSISQLNAEIKKIGEKAGFGFEFLNKKQIASLKMGGLLAVNQGSKEEPIFNILKWKPENAKNKRPIILVGKGIVFDTGGLSLKSTKNSMDFMKSDMAGGATVIGVLNAVAKSRLPVYVIGLIPTTDNSLNEKSYAPGDVIQMHNNITVEVMNTDAEGRLILADALSYAKKYNPKLVLDISTLTGSAVAAVGHYATVFMGKTDSEIKNNIVKSADYTHEKVVEFPFFDEYADSLKSDIADLKNIGEPAAGAISAGKFLEKFIDYPWLHFDIAGTAFVQHQMNYKGKGATGILVRLLFEFLKNI